MATKSKRRKKQWWHTINRRLFVFSAAVLLLATIAVGHWAIRRHEISVDKARFAQAEIDVQTIAGKIVSTVGQPQDRKSGGKCTYASEEFTKGPLTCDAYQYLAYGANSPDDANLLATTVSTHIKSLGKPWSFDKVTQVPDGSNMTHIFSSLPTRGGWENYFEKYRYMDSFNCGVSYQYFDSTFPLGGYPPFNVRSPQTLLINIGCTKKAVAEFYPTGG